MFVNNNLSVARWTRPSRRATGVRPKFILIAPWHIDEAGKPVFDMLHTRVATVRQRNDARWQFNLHKRALMQRAEDNLQGTVDSQFAAVERIEREFTGTFECDAVCTLALHRDYPGKGVCLEFRAPRTPGGRATGERFRCEAYCIPRSTGWFHQGGCLPDNAPSEWHLFEFWQWERDPETILLACQKLADTLQLALDVRLPHKD